MKLSISDERSGNYCAIEMQMRAAIFYRQELVTALWRMKIASISIWHAINVQKHGTPIHPIAYYIISERLFLAISQLPVRSMTILCYVLSQKDDTNTLYIIIINY